MLLHTHTHIMIHGMYSPHMVMKVSVHLELPTLDCTNVPSQRVVFTGAC